MPRGVQHIKAWGWSSLLLPAFVFPAIAEEPSPTPRSLRFADGQVMFEFDAAALAARGWELAVRDSDPQIDSLWHLSSPTRLDSRVEVAAGAELVDVQAADISTVGAVLLAIGDRREVIGDLSIHYANGRWFVIDGLGQREVFELGSVTLDAPRWAQAMRLAAEVLVSRTWAQELGEPRYAEGPIGRLVLTGNLRTAGEETVGLAEGASPSNTGSTAGVIGPDVIVGNLHQSASYGSSGGISAFAVGTVSCNVGDVWLNWINNTNQHPVIGQSMYRLKNDRFEHIGQSWLKHGFYALSEGLCYSDCQSTNGSHLGVHCSDPYSASLNGTQYNLGPKYQVNAHTGYFDYPPASPPYSGIIARRLQVKNSDLDPALDGGGIYFVEGQYVTPDDAAAGNQNNNASYRRITVSGGGTSWGISLTSTTQREQPGIRAWKDTDPTVVETDVQVPDDGLFIVAAKVTDLANGYWHYEYAVQNLNSHRSARAFTVPIDPQGKIINIGFHDVAYHSGEPYFLTDWTPVVSGDTISWSTLDYNTSSVANALRWGTLYNFRFDANRPPQSTDVTLTLYRPGSPGEVTATTVGPVTNGSDCNGNNVPDSVDIANGTSQDCDGDLVPDECEPASLSSARVATGLSSPVFVTGPPGDTARLFIVEQPGVVKILTGGAVLATPFLDISELVTFAGERGLFSIAFDPDYAANGYFYACYTDVAGDVIIARFSVSGDPNVANPASQTILKTIVHQDAANHNGGQLQFGPDGYLYAGIGDGGGGYDPFNRAQDPSTLLGKMIRLDVDNPPDYVPIDNPFAPAGLPADEIWAFGLRNPWRFSFDRLTGDLYIADVGQALLEEINFQPAGSTGGENYGWRCMEGSSCTGLSGCTCNGPTLTLPISEYSHINDDCSITGGYVYRGCAIPNFQGTYFYADYCSGAIRSFRYSGGAVTEAQDRTVELTPLEGPITSIASFGEDAEGELYIVSVSGDVYKIVPATGPGPQCGNGVVEAGEECDDGDTLPGDGCDELCHVENAPPNDLCENAQQVGDGTYAFNTNDSGTDGPSETDVCLLGSPGSDIWYCYTPPYTGTATISLCGSTFDTMLTTYADCTCPAIPSAGHCNDDNCGVASELTVPVSACQPILIRVGGFDAAQGVGQLAITAQQDPIVNDCDANGVEDASDIACGTRADNDSNGIPDVCEVVGDYIRGGRMYDRWWSELSLGEPTTDHPLWAYRPDTQSNSATGSATWRCVECHGWDYRGVDGEYGAGPHRTGFPGIIGYSSTVPALMELLREPPSNGGGAGVPNGHDYGSVLTSQQIDDLVAFVTIGAIDTDTYLDPASGVFAGDEVAGETYYHTGGTISQCVTCHGSDGAAINFGTPEQPEYLGTAAVYEPLHFFHRARMGFPGTPMLGWLANGGANQGAADIGRYAQLSFPADCLIDAHCNDSVDCTLDTCGADGRCVYTPDDAACADDGVFCNGPQVCSPALGCVGDGNPCLDPNACDEDVDGCGCEAPLVSVPGSRYLAISPQPPDSPAPTRILITPVCSEGVPKYVGLPSGALNIAYLTTDSEASGMKTPVQWGGTVYASGLDIVPETQYMVQADCGIPGSPVLTAAVVVTTPKFGDIIRWYPTYGPPDGVIDAVDITMVIDGFKARPGALSLYTLDLYGCVPNKIIDAIDIVGAVEAFKGVTYAATLCPGPCDSTGFAEPPPDGRVGR